MSLHNKEQTKFIQSKLEDCKLLGIPGGGKTKATIDKIIYHRKKKDFKTSKEFLVLTFNRSTKEDFLKKGKQLINGLFTTVNVRTFHSLSGSIVSAMLKRSSSSIETIVKCAYDIIRSNNSIDIRTIRPLRDIKAIFVDEAQDLTQLYYNLLLVLKQKLNCKLILIGDPNQNIYQFNNGSDKYLLNHKGTEHKLVTNYRSTKNIVSLINHVRPWKHLLPDMKAASKIDGTKPYVYVETIDNILKDIITEIRNYKGKLTNIAIIGPVKKSRPNGKTYVNIGLQLIANELSKQKIPYVQHYSIESERSDYNNKHEYINDHVNLFTCHGSKGLEFKKVLLLNFHHATYGRTPTEEDNNKFNYLWYVGLSRAKKELKIYVDKSRSINSNIHKCPHNTYNANVIINRQTYIYEKDKPPLTYPITDTINDKKYFDENTFDYFEKSFKFNKSYQSTKLYTVNGDLSTYDKYSGFCGIFFEHVYMYYHKNNRHNFTKYMELLKKNISNSIYVPSKFSKCLRDLKLEFNNTVTLNELDQFKNRDDLWKEFHVYLSAELKNDYTREVILYTKSLVVDNNFKSLINNINNLLKYKKEPSMILLAEICLFQYQWSTEAKYLKKKIDITDFIKKCKPWINQIKQYSNTVTNKFNIQVKNNHPYIQQICGTADIVDDQKYITELKFTNSIQTKHEIQTILYYNNINYKWTDTIEFDIINLKTGIKHTYKINPKVSNYEFNLYMCKLLNIKIHNPIIMYDLEVNARCMMTARNSDIIERHCQDYLTGWVISAGLIKPSQKIYHAIIELTGITDKLIKKGSDKNIDKFKEDIKTFLKYSSNPIFVAHNGNSFDHIVMRDNDIFDNYVKCLDSKGIIRMITPCKIPNMPLGDIYECILGYKSKLAHRAEADVIMMIDIFNKLKFQYKDFIDIIQNEYNTNKVDKLLVVTRTVNERVIEQYDILMINSHINIILQKKEYDIIIQQYNRNEHSIIRKIYNKLETYKMNRLKELAKQHNIENYYRMNKLNILDDLSKVINYTKLFTTT